MKINKETTISEEQVLFNKLSYEEQQFILRQMRLLQPCELKCELEEKKIPEKFKINYELDEENTINLRPATMLECDLACRINEIIYYLKSKGE